MRKLLIITCVSFVVLILTSPAYSSDWLQVADSAGNEKNYLDLGSITYKKPLAKFWTKNMDRKGEITKTAFYLNCEAGSGAIKEILIYNAEDVLVKSYSFKEEKLQWAKITPRSSLHVFRNLVCQTAQQSVEE
jgi:hypothetical protein